MRVARRHVLPVALGMAVIALGCSDSTGPSDRLTSEELNALGSEMGAFFLGGALGPTLSAGTVGSSLKVVPVELEIDVTIPCPRGGTTRLNGDLEAEIDNVSQTVVAEVKGRHRPNDCAFLAHGKKFEVSGDISATAYAKTVRGVPVGTHRVTMSGWFTWESSDGRDGSCSVSYTAVANYDDNYAEVDGSFCESKIKYRGPLTH